MEKSKTKLASEAVEGAAPAPSEDADSKSTEPQIAGKQVYLDANGVDVAAPPISRETEAPLVAPQVDESQAITYMTLEECATPERTYLLEFSRDYLAVPGVAAGRAPREVGAELFRRVNEIVAYRNRSLKETDESQLKIYGAWRSFASLSPELIAETILATKNVASIYVFHGRSRVNLGLVKASSCPLGVYDDDQDSPMYGLYNTSEEVIYDLVCEIDPDLSPQKMKQVFTHLQLRAPIKCVSQNRDLVPVRNGVFDLKAKKLKSFSPDLVFTQKVHVNYVENAPLVLIDEPRWPGGSWDIESWLSSLHDDPAVVAQYWNIVAAAMRVNRSWGKIVCFIAGSGCNGKGTLCSMIEDMLGGAESDAVIHATLDNMRDEYLEDLPNATLIYGDENDVGAFHKSAALMKSLATGDPVAVNRKYQKAIKACFSGLIIQNFNSLPLIKDRTDSLYRRIYPVPFDKSFSGVQINEIKDDYLHRDEVQEYVLWRVLSMDDVSLECSEASQKLLDEIKNENSPVRQFFNEVMPDLAWGFCPAKFLYDLYQGWYKSMNGGRCTRLERKHFCEELEKLVAESSEWTFDPRRIYIKDEYRALCTAEEPLIAEYKLEEWSSSHYLSGGTEKSPLFRTDKYTGVFFRVAADGNQREGNEAASVPVDSHEGSAVRGLIAMNEAGVVDSLTLSHESGDVLWSGEKVEPGAVSTAKTENADNKDTACS